MDAGTVAAWIQFVLWAFAAIIGITKLVKQWRKEGPMSLPLKGVYLALLFGFAVSAISLYFNYRPRIVQVVKIVEKPVDRIVEKIVQADCPKVEYSKPSAKTERKSAKIDTPPTPAQPSMKQDCGGGDCAQSSGQTGGITAGQLILPGAPVQLHLARGAGPA